MVAVLGVLGFLVYGLGTGHRFPLLHAETAADGQGSLADLLRDAPTRPVEGRLTGGFGYAPFDPLERPRLEISQQTALITAARRVYRGADPPRRQPSRVLAALSLVEGNAGRAVDLFAAFADRGGEARDWSDLAAAYLERARSAGTAGDLVRALDAAEKALEIEPGMGEATFNRAVALEALGLRAPARAAWSRVASLEPPGSGWSAEAARRNAALSRPEPRTTWNETRDRLLAQARAGDRQEVSALVRDHPLAVRELLEDELPARWAESRKAGDQAEASAVASSGSLIAHALEQVGGDPLPREIFDLLVEGGGEPPRDPARLDDLIQGHLAYATGMEHYGVFEIAAARESFEVAERRLTAAGSPAALWATFQRARCDFVETDYSGALALLEPLLTRARTGAYPNLAARTLWVIGLTHFVTGRIEDAHQEYAAALDLFELTAEHESATVVHSLLADVLEALGQLDEAWRHRHAAIEGLPSLRASGRRTTVLIEATLAVVAMGYPRVAARVVDEEIGELDPSTDAVPLAIALQVRAAAEVAGDQDERALATLSEAADLISDEEPGVWKAITGDLLKVRGWLARTSDPKSAVSDLTEAVTLYQDTDFHLQLADLLRRRAVVLREVGDERGAERDLDAGIAEREAQRTAIYDAALRIGHFAGTLDVYDEAIRLQADLGHAERALDLSERSRGRDLIERLRQARAGDGQDALPEVLRASEITRRLPPGTAIVEYHVLDDRTLAWWIDRQGVRIATIADRAEALAGRLRTLDRALAGGDDGEARASLGTLFKDLLGPFLDVVDQTPRIVFAPDGALWDVPFSALIDPRTGEYLIRRATVSLAPSASLALTPPGAAAPSGTLILGNPSLSPDDASDYRPLPGAEREAEELAALYGVSPLTGPDATPDALIRGLAESRIVQIGAHAEVNVRNPLLSSLVLAPGQSGGSGRLYAHEVLDRRLGGPEVIVLAACSTAAGIPPPGEGVAGLVRAFLAAGVPAVIASRWQVEDRLNEALFLELHRQLLAGQAPADALRRAQLAVLDGPDEELHSPAVWASFNLYGSGR